MRSSTRLAVAGVLGLALCVAATPAQAVILQVSGAPTTGDPNLRLWLDSTAAGSLWQDTGGTTAVTPGSDVARWDDQSGNGLNVLQNTPGNRPVYNASVGSLNSQAAVDFTGGGGGTVLSATNTTGILGNADRTVITVWQNTAFTGQNYQHSFHMGDGTTNEGYGHSTARTGGEDTPMGNHYYGSGFDSWERSNLRGNIAVSVWDGDAGTGTNGLDSWYVNGAYAGAADRIPLATGASQLQIGSRLNPPTEGMAGHLAEVIVYDSTVTPTERAQLESYLATKYNIGVAQLTDYNYPVPSDPTLKAWYRADAGVVTSGGVVTQWIDQAAPGDASRILSAPAANQPTLIASVPGLNGMPAIRFDDALDFLQRPANNSPVTGDSDRTVFVVIANNVSGGDLKDHVLHFGNTGNGQAYGVLTEAGANIGNHYWGTGFFAGSAAATPAATAITFAFDGDGVNDLTGLDSFYVDGVLVGTVDMSATGAAPGGVLNTGLSQFMVGSRLTGPTEQFTGDIAEILIYDSLLSQDQIDQIHGYLQLKYGILIEGANTIPEPATVSLVGLGLAALARRRRRRR